jgi:hypothetical protein
MWDPWRNLLQPWRTAPGWEFDLLRTLPPDVAKELYSRAYRRAGERVLLTWWWWTFFGVLMVLLGLSLIAVWIAAAALGLGPAGQIGLEFAFHITLGVIVFHPLGRLVERYGLPYVRAALADELLWFAQDELAPPRPPTVRCRHTEELA